MKDRTIQFVDLSARLVVEKLMPNKRPVGDGLEALQLWFSEDNGNPS